MQVLRDLPRTPGDPDYFDYATLPTKAVAVSIVADPKFAYPSFEAVLANLDDVLRALETGSREISRRTSGQIHDAIRSP